MNPITIYHHQNHQPFREVPINCEWRPVILDGKHKIKAIYWSPDEEKLVHVQITSPDHHFALILIPIDVETQEFANLFLTLKIAKRNPNDPYIYEIKELIEFMQPKLGKFSHQTNVKILNFLVNLYDV